MGASASPRPRAATPLTFNRQRDGDKVLELVCVVLSGIFSTLASRSKWPATHGTHVDLGVVHARGPQASDHLLVVRLALSLPPFRHTRHYRKRRTHLERATEERNGPLDLCAVAQRHGQAGMQNGCPIKLDDPRRLALEHLDLCVLASMQSHAIKVRHERERCFEKVQRRLVRAK